MFPGDLDAAMALIGGATGSKAALTGEEMYQVLGEGPVDNGVREVGAE